MLITLLAQATDPPADAAAAANDSANTGIESLPLQDAGAYLTPEKISELLQSYGLPLFWAILILIVAYLTSNFANRAVRSSLGKARIDETLARFFGKLAKYSVLTLGLIIALGRLGVEVTAFAAIIAAAGFAIGMALSGTLGHFASGVMLLIFRPFKVGDVISAAGVVGKVYEIELFTTALDTPDNRRIIVPNGSIYGSTIENITHHGTRRVDISVGVEYAADIDKTREVLDKAARSIEGILSEPAHAIYLGGLGDSAVKWNVRVWCKTSDYWNVLEKGTRAVKMHLDDAGIGIPFPQMQVHLDKSE